MIRIPQAALSGAALLLILSGCSLEDNQLTLAVSTEEPAPAIAETLSAALSAKGLSVDIEPILDATVAIEKIRRGELDLAIIEEPDQPLRGLITLAPLYPSVLHVLHNRNGDSSNFVDLIRGALVYAGPTGGAAHRLLMQLSKDFSIGEDEYELLDNPWTQSPDVYFIFGGLLSDESVAQLVGYRLFSFGAEGDVAGGSVADGVVLKHHHLRPFLLPKGVYHTLTNDAVLTLSIRSVLVASESFDEQLAYDIAWTLFNQSQEIALRYPLVTRELNESVQTTELMLPLHEGTRRYLDRDRPDFIERHVDVLALYFTIAITLLTGSFAYFRHRSQVRKDRVDVFYTRLLVIRDNMQNTEDQSIFASCYKEVLVVQREVLDLLIDERIAADTSLIAFVNLSNQMIDELERRSRRMR